MMKDIGLLVLRVSFGLILAICHGWGKMVSLVEGKSDFPDPLGIGNIPSLILAALGEFVFALLVAAGFKTRLTAAPVAITMLVAGLVFHWSDPFSDKEHALLFAAAFVALTFTGGGRLSVDGFLGRSRNPLSGE